MSLAIEIISESGLIKVDLDVIKKAEARVMEIATASPQQALELEAFFILSISSIIEDIADVNLSFKRAEANTERVRSLVVLDLEENGTKKASNADIRKALVYSNSDYLQALDKMNQLEALLTYLKDKKEVLNKSYFAVKDIIAVDDGHSNFHKEHING